jgi:hypothetical protein
MSPTTKKNKRTVFYYSSDSDSDSDYVYESDEGDIIEEEFENKCKKRTLNNDEEQIGSKRKREQLDNDDEEPDKKKPKIDEKKQNDIIIYNFDDQKDDDILSFFINNILNPTKPPPNKEPVKTRKTIAKKKPIVNLCPNPMCDHKIDTDLEMCVTPQAVETIQELIQIGRLYHCKKRRTYYGINLRIVCGLESVLKELDDVVGMTEVKLDIVQQILYFTQPIENLKPCGSCIDCKQGDTCIKTINVDMLHGIVSGPPGVGKTMLAKILCKIYAAMGILSKGTFTSVRRSDLVGEYLGHTAVKTQEVIDKCEGGMLFIDEAYSLGSPEGRDSFAKECVDTLTLNLTEGKTKFILYIAGYKDALDINFFSQNEGLRRRFPFEYNIKPYKGRELAKILTYTINAQSWKYDDASYEELEDFIASKGDIFKYNGGDMETLFLYSKIHRNKRIMFKKNIDRKLITYEDILEGFKVFIRHRKSEDMEDDIKPYNFMYI